MAAAAGGAYYLYQKNGGFQGLAESLGKAGLGLAEEGAKAGANLTAEGFNAAVDETIKIAQFLGGDHVNPPKVYVITYEPDWRICNKCGNLYLNNGLYNRYCSQGKDHTTIDLIPANSPLRDQPKPKAK